MGYEWIGLALVCGIVGLLMAVVSASGLSAGLKRILILGLALRVVGAVARHEVLFRFYGGVGDATGYFGYGQAYAASLRAFDFTIFAPAEWWAGHWWGTQFIRYLTGFVVAVIGPSMRAGFVVYSLLSFGGLCLFIVAFRRAYPHLRCESYAAWILLWPSLWFWPSSIGKESVMLLALGLVTAGYVGRRERVGWIMLFAGLALMTAVRPHVAGVTIVCIALAQWLGAGKRPTFVNIAQALALGVAALFLLNNALGQLGLGDADLEGIQEFVQYRAGLTAQGGSNIGAPTAGWSQIPLAFVNILMRPFPWEAHNPAALVAALELALFWTIVWGRRRRIWHSLKEWRSDRFLRLSLPMTAMYVAMIGLVFGNLGIIARQRIVVLPLLLLLLEALPARTLQEALRRSPVASPRADALPPRIAARAR